MLKIKDKKVLKSLKAAYNLEYVKYEVFSRTFIYKRLNQEEKSMTFHTLVGTLDSTHEMYGTLEELRRSYFPRRLKETIESFYTENGMEIPDELILSEKGFELVKDNEVHYIEYKDDFTEFLKEFFEVYGLEYKDFKINPSPEDYKDEYHQL